MAVLFDPHDPSRVYYGTDTRAQALLVGAALALLVMRPRRRPRQTSATAGMIGFEVVGIVAVGYLGWLWTHVADTSTWMYSGGFLIEALAVAALIAAAARGRIRRSSGRCSRSRRSEPSVASPTASTCGTGRCTCT